MKFTNKALRYISAGLAATTLNLSAGPAISETLKYKPRGPKIHVSNRDQKEENLGNPIDPVIVGWSNMYFFPLQADTSYASIDTTSIDYTNLIPTQPKQPESTKQVTAPTNRWYIANDNPLYTARHTKTLMTPLQFSRNIVPNDVLNIDNYYLFNSNPDSSEVIDCADTIRLNELGIRVGIREIPNAASLLDRISQYFNKTGDKQAAANYHGLSLDVSKNPNLKGYVVWANDKDNKYCQSLPFLVDLSLEERVAQPDTVFIPSPKDTVAVTEYQIRPEVKEAVIPKIKKPSKKKCIIIGALVGIGTYTLIELLTEDKEESKPQLPDGWGHNRDDPHNGVENP